VKVGIEGNERTEVLDGVAEGDRVVTTGAAGLRNGDPIVLAGGGAGRGRGRGGQAAAGNTEQPPAATRDSGFGTRTSETSLGSKGAEGSRGSAGSSPTPDPGAAGREGGRGRFGGGRRGGQRPGGAPQTGPDTQ